MFYVSLNKIHLFTDVNINDARWVESSKDLSGEEFLSIFQVPYVNRHKYDHPTRTLMSSLVETIYWT